MKFLLLELVFAAQQWGGITFSPFWHGNSRIATQMFSYCPLVFYVWGPKLDRRTKWMKLDWRKKWREHAFLRSSILSFGKRTFLVIRRLPKVSREMALFYCGRVLFGVRLAMGHKFTKSLTPPQNSFEIQCIPSFFVAAPNFLRFFFLQENYLKMLPSNVLSQVFRWKLFLPNIMMMLPPHRLQNWKIHPFYSFHS